MKLYILIFLTCILIIQANQVLSALIEISTAQQDQIQISSQQLYNSNALNCYTLNNRETEKEYYQCMYDAQ